MMKSRRRLLMNQGLSVDVSALVFSYTGTWTDTVMEISGQQYRVLQLKSNGTLTFDEQMVKKKVPFDVWGVGKGGAGSVSVGGAAGSSSMYTSCPNWSYDTHGSNYNNVAITVTNYAVSASNGTASGWSFKNNAVARSLTASAVITNVHSASLGDIFSFSGTSRSGSAWFSLPASNNGAGGSAGGSYSVHSTGTCSICGASYGGGTSDSTYAYAGTNGIIVIRIPLEG